MTKNITTGEGGMILSRREEDAARLKGLALHGMSKDAWKRFGDDGYKHYYVTECGFKYDMMDLQPAIGIHQLNRVEYYWLRKIISRIIMVAEKLLFRFGLINKVNELRFNSNIKN